VAKKIFWAIQEEQTECKFLMNLNHTEEVGFLCMIRNLYAEERLQRVLRSFLRRTWRLAEKFFPRRTAF